MLTSLVFGSLALSARAVLDLPDTGAQNTVASTSTEVVPEDRLNVTGATSDPGIFILNYGRGTTATRGVYHAFCSHHIPSYHWTDACNCHSREAWHGVQAAQHLHILYRVAKCNANNIPPSRCHNLLELYASLYEVVPLEYRINETSQEYVEHIRTSYQETVPDFQDVFTHPNVLISLDDLSPQKWLDNTRYQLRIMMSSKLRSWADSPLPNMASAVMEASTNIPHHNIMTMRDPTAWAKSRIKEHRGNVDVLCKEAIWPDRFDILKCLESGIAKANGKPVLMKNLLMDGEHNFKPLVSAMRNYQNYYRQHMDASIDMFARRGFMSDHEIIREFTPKVYHDLETKSNRQLRGSTKHR